MKKAIWLRPEAVAQIEFLEWTGADRLRHSRFVGLRDDKVALSVTKERNGES
jgi:bifunctional non-homologous end joining protein LigD